jgi:mannose/fructose/N-acetylgalactosamine-specific phosphotransferase system component IID
MLSEILTVPRVSLFIAVSVVVGVKVIAGVCLVIVAMRINPKKVDLYFTKMKGIRSSKVARKNSRSPIRGALEDLMSPLFLMTLILTLVFMLVTKQETSALIWGLLRPLAIGFLLFYLIRVLPLEMLLERLSRTRFKTFSKVALESVAALKRIEIK